MMEFHVIAELAIVATLLIALGGSFEAGFRIGRGAAARGRVPGSLQMGSIQGAVLGLLGLLLGFSFAGASARFMERQDLIIRDAGAIGTAWQRAELLGEPACGTLRHELSTGVRLRLDFPREGVAGQRRVLDEIDACNGRMWQAVVDGIEVRPASMMAVIGPFTEVMDMKAKRVGAGLKRLPALVMGILVSCSAIAMAVIGYGSGLAGNRMLPMTVSLTLLVGASLWATIDMDHPRDGLIRLDDGPIRDALPDD